MGSIPAAAPSTIGVVATYVPSKDVPRFRLPDGAFLFWESSSNGRALALHARGNGIDAHVFQGVLLNPILPTFPQRNGKSIAPFIFSRISLVAEHRTCNAEVVSSILTFGFIFLEPCLVAFILIRFQAILILKYFNRHI